MIKSIQLQTWKKDFLIKYHSIQFATVNLEEKYNDLNRYKDSWSNQSTEECLLNSYLVSDIDSRDIRIIFCCMGL